MTFSRSNAYPNKDMTTRAHTLTHTLIPKHTDKESKKSELGCLRGNHYFPLVWTLCRLCDSHPLSYTPIFPLSVSLTHTQKHTLTLLQHMHAQHICTHVHSVCIKTSADTSVHRTMQIFACVWFVFLSDWCSSQNNWSPLFLLTACVLLSSSMC